MEGLIPFVVFAIVVIAQVISIKNKSKSADSNRSEQIPKVSSQSSARQGAISMSDYIQQSETPQEASQSGIAAAAHAQTQNIPHTISYGMEDHRLMTSEQLENEDYDYDYTLNKLGVLVRKRRGTFIEGSPEAYMILHGTHNHYGKDKGN